MAVVAAVMAAGAAVMAVLVAIVAVAAPAGADEAPALAPAAVNSLLDCRFGSGQVFDISYTKSGTPGVDRALIVTASAVPGQSAVNPAGPLNGVVAATDYFAFHPSSTHLTTYELRLYDRDGVLKRVVDNTGTFELAGPDVLLYHGGGVTDTLLLTRGVWRYGETGVFAIDQENLINNAALQYTGCTGPWRMPAPDRVTPVSPHRLLDTRDGAALSPSADLSLPVAGHGGVPVTASAVVLNVTVDQPQADGWVAAFPCGATPTTSTINFVRGQTLANLAVVAPGANGAVCFRSTVAGHLVVDLAGYLDAGGEAAYQPLHAARALDTRTTGGRVPAGGSVAVPVAGLYGTPNSSVAAQLNVTVTNPAAAGYLTVYPCGAAVPLASNVNFAAGQTVANAVLARLGEGGAVCVRSAVATDVVIDVNGAYGPTGDALPMAVTPFRVADTRTSAPIAAGGVLEVDLANRPGLHRVTPAGALLNVTVADAAAPGYLTVYACDRDRPFASHVNYLTGQSVANFVQVPLSAGTRKACVFSTAPAQVVVDVSGALAAYA
ncbi:MAG: hypothetical protein AB7O92_09435 [Acidimicrobiia bacterium]